MSTAASPERPPPARELHAPRVGRVVGGLILVTVGVGWLLEIWGVDVPWDAVLPGALVVVGAALLLVAGRGESQAGLITTGIVITVLLVLGSVVDVPLGGGVGARTERPTTYEQVRREYRLGVGELTVDLTDVSNFPPFATAAVKEVAARVGIGHLVVVVPEGATVEISARAGLGNVRLYEQEASGVDASRATGYRGGVVMVVNAAVGLGQVEVVRG